MNFHAYQRLADCKPFIVRRAASIASNYFGLGGLSWDDRRARVTPQCTARQIAIYLMVAGLGMQRQTVAKLVDRHHSTVDHAVAVIEELRENSDFDAEMTRLELELRLSVGLTDDAMGLL